MIFERLKSGYQKVKAALTKKGFVLGDKIRHLFSRGINEETIDQYEQILYEADIGVKTINEITDRIREIYRNRYDVSIDDLINTSKQHLLNIIAPNDSALLTQPANLLPQVILIVGVNGNGKTTSVAKLANYLKGQNKKVLIAAADTYRAAATEQLEIWAQRLGVDIVKGVPNSDPAAVTFDAITAGKSRGCDVVIIDTAGRLHTRADLMQELEKIKRICNKVQPGTPHETYLVLDATTGQNGIDQAKIFHKYTPISGLILTKLDGTAKGGGIVNIQRELSIPVKFIGVGESLDDLEIFDPQLFVNALFD